ncbi:LOW QUALITY PROTEIN: NPC intracellular cholesterol transporter 2-like [Oculina patagonica]
MAKTLILVLFALCFLAFGFSTHVKFVPCGGTGKVAFVDVTPCAAQPCRLKKGSEEHISVEFTPGSNITSAKTVVHGIIKGISVPFPVDNPEVCNEHGITCPMTAGKTYTFQDVLPIKSAYPALQLLVKWEMQDQSGDEIYCWQLPVQIVS